MIEKSNDLMNQLHNDSSNNESNVDKSDIDESSSNSNNYSSSNDSISEDIDFDIDSYQFKIESKHKNDTHEYSCDPMIYHLLNDNDMYRHDPNIRLNVEYYENKYSDNQILEIDDLFNDNIKSFISDFNIENYEINNDNNNVINISNNKKYLAEKEVEWIRYEYSVSNNLLYNNIDQEKNYLSTYEDEWPGSITNKSKKCT